MNSLETRQPESRNLIQILGWYTMFYLVSLIGFIGASPGIWFCYQTLRAPAWAPPGWLFTVVWTVLYGLIGRAAWGIKESNSSPTRSAGLLLLLVQLVLMVAWPWVLFTLHNLGVSNTVRGLGFLVSVSTTLLFWKTQPESGRTMLIPVGWNLVVAILNFALWQMNV
jgi:tryptophan-rich sensory protein